MNTSKIESIAKLLVAEGKGILAADESTSTIKKRFDSIGIESTEDSRRRYRQLLFTTVEIEKYISGVIMYEETLKQSTNDGKPFPQLLVERGIQPGIKVDMGKTDLFNFENEYITLGLDTLRDRMEEYKNLGAVFTKWRAVIKIGENIPSSTAIEANTSDLARYAALVQAFDMVPIVEPEILMDGNHTIEDCRRVTYSVLKELFTHLNKHKVHIPGILLKPNMIVPGKENEKVDSQQIAENTISCFSEVLPDELPGVVFLSGGQGPEEATQNLQAIVEKANNPWKYSFSFGRALQEPVLQAWKGSDDNIQAAQTAFIQRARMNSLAVQGAYKGEE